MGKLFNCAAAAFCCIAVRFTGEGPAGTYDGKAFSEAAAEVAPGVTLAAAGVVLKMPCPVPYIFAFSPSTPIAVPVAGLKVATFKAGVCAAAADAFAALVVEAPKEDNPPASPAPP